MTSQSHGISSPPPQRWRALALLAVAQFMLILDVTVVTVAMPQMGADLGLGREPLTWVMSGYTLAFGGLMLLGGRAADIYGPRRLVLTGLAVFAFASLAVGLGSTAWIVIAGRALQGIAAAMLSPAALSVVVRLFDGEERNRALGIWSALGGVGAAAGVLLGGVLTAGPGWPWVFFVNVPVGVVLIIGLMKLLPELPAWAATARLDAVGALLVSGATALMIYGFIGAGEHGWAGPTTWFALIGSVAAYALFRVWLRRTAQPLVEPELLRRRPVYAGAFVIFVATGLMVAVFFLGTFYLQQVQNHGPLMTGLLFLPVALATMLGAQIGGRLIGRTGGRNLGVAGLLVAGAGLSVPAIFLSTASTVVAVSVGSAGLGALFVVAAATALSSVTPHEAGVASGALSTCHELGASLGAALISGVVAASLLAGTDVGFERGYLVAAAVAAAAALVTALVVPVTVTTSHSEDDASAEAVTP